MTTPEGLTELERQLIRRGVTPAKAVPYAALIGAVFEEDSEGKWIVRDEQGQIIDRV